MSNYTLMIKLFVDSYLKLAKMYASPIDERIGLCKRILKSWRTPIDIFLELERVWPTTFHYIPRKLPLADAG